MPTVDFPSGVPATNPTRLVGANAVDAAGAAVSSIGLTLLNAADAPTARDSINGAAAMAVRYSHFEPFLNNISAVGQGLVAANTGGSQTAQVVDGRNGVTRNSTAAAATADRVGGITTTAVSNISLGFGQAKMVAVFAPAVNLPDGTNTGFIRSGFLDSASATESVDAVMFRSTNGGNYFAVCRSNNIETATDTGVAPVLGTYVTCGIIVNASATSVVFQINGSTVATITTNIPTGAGRQVGHGVTIHRVAATAVALAMDVDSIYLGLDHPALLPI